MRTRQDTEELLTFKKLNEQIKNRFNGVSRRYNRCRPGWRRITKTRAFELQDFVSFLTCSFFLFSNSLTNKKNPIIQCVNVSRGLSAFRELCRFMTKLCFTFLFCRSSCKASCHCHHVMHDSLLIEEEVNQLRPKNKTNRDDPEC